MEFTDKIDFTEGTRLTWPIKLLFFIGGQIGMSTIGIPFAFLFNNAGAGFFILLGLCMVVGSIVMTRAVDNEKLILAVAYPLYLSGHGLFVGGLVWGVEIENINVIVLINTLILGIEWIFCRNHFMRQVILLTIIILIPLMFIDFHDSGVSRVIFFYYAILLLVGYGLTIMYDADKFDKENIYAQYIPTIRFCTTVVSIGYALCGIDSIVQSVICAIFSFSVACILLSKQMKGQNKFTLCIALIFLGCAASAITPNISLAILGLILAYTVLDYFSIAAFGIFMVYSLGKFYYDLDMLLVHKSYLLMASGIVFLSLFYFIKKLAK